MRIFSTPSSASRRLRCLLSTGASESASVPFTSHAESSTDSLRGRAFAQKNV
jgi:hypothetical protein